MHNAVGIFPEHAGTRERDRALRFLDAHAASMPRAALRLAIEKLGTDERTRYLAG